jgi:sugar lactone lactonase YvrE
MGRQNHSELRSRVLVFLSLLLFFTSARDPVHAQGPAATITSVAGTEGCSSLTADPAGNLYFVGDNNRVQKIADGTGKITPVSPPDLGIGGGIAVDAAGNLYLAHMTFNNVRKVAAGTGAITTVAGTPDKYNGLGRRIPGPATQAFLLGPVTLALDSTGNLYIAENGATTFMVGVFKVAAATGVITSVPLKIFPAKRGDPVDRITYDIARGGKPVLPAAFAFDANGNLYFGDHFHDVVWEVGPDGGQLKRVVGTGATGYSGDGGLATDAQISGAVSLAFDGAGNLYFADQGNNRIRMVAKKSGIITTVAGNGTSRNLNVSVAGTDGNLHYRYQKADDGDGGPALQARISTPDSIAFDRSGNLYICGGILRKVTGVGTSQR